MFNTDNKLDSSETKGKPKITSIVASIPDNDQWIVQELDAIAAKQNRSRSYVALKLLEKFLPKFKGEVL